MPDVFVICPVRQLTEEQRQQINNLVAEAELTGLSVHVPFRDTKQDEDPIGIRICTDNYKALAEAEKVWIWYDPSSQGSLFDIGMAFALKKPIYLLNEVEATSEKSFSNVLLEWAKQ